MKRLVKDTGRKIPKEDRIIYIKSKLMENSKKDKFTREDIKEILDYEVEFIEELLLDGYSVTFGNIGRFDLNYKKPRDGYMTQYKTKENVIISPTNSYNIPTFIFSPSFKKVVRDKTTGSAFGFNKEVGEEIE